MKALYRKYRPVSLDTVVAQDQVVDPLKNALKHNKISHAYLFCGPRGTGKTSIARIFAHEINGFKYELEDSYIDIIEIDAASNTGVDNIRELREKAIIAPTEGKYKIYIIDEVHMLSKSAFNALLKIMEEPPEHVVFIMATTNPEKVPVTITSRAQLFTFRLCDPAVMQKHLASIAEKEGIKITEDALKIIVERGGGSFRDSISLLDQISTLSSDEISANLVESTLGLPATQKIENLLASYTSGDLDSAVETLRELLNSGTEAEPLASFLVEHIVSHPTPETLNLASRLFDVQAPFARAKLLVALLGNGGAVSPLKEQYLQSGSQSGFSSRNIAPLANRPDPSPTPQTSPNGEFLEATAEKKASPEEEQYSNRGNSGAYERGRRSPSPATTARSNSHQASLNEIATQRKDAKRLTGARDSGSPIGDVAPLQSVDFLELLASKSSALASIVSKGACIATSSAIDIYPSSKGFQKILQSDKNHDLLASIAGGIPINIHEPGEKPAGKTSENSQTSEISAIMGDIQEVNEDADDPFGTD